MRAAALSASLGAALLAGACAPLPSPGPVVPASLRAIGTEPFWAANVAGTTLTYRTPEDQEGTTIAVRRSDAGGAAVFEGMLAARPLRLRIVPGQCSDGMSDRSYAYVAELDIGSERRSGCADAG